MVIPQELSYTITYTLNEGDPLEFPSGKLLKANNNPYITIIADFKMDERTVGAIAETEALIVGIREELSKAAADSGENNPPYPEETDKLVGATPTGDEALALDAAIKEAEAAIAGEEVKVTVELDDFERYEEDVTIDNVEHKEGEYKTDENGDMIPLVVTVKYRAYNTDDILAAKDKLAAALKAAKNANISSFAQTVVTLSSASQEADKVYRSVTIVNDGIYKITITGANGGHARATTEKTAFGGKGGYVVAQKSFKQGDVLKIRLGAEGKGTARLNDYNTGLEADGAIGNDNPAGGWPNGGAGGKMYKNSAPGSGGGGATEVFFAGNRDEDDLIAFDNTDTTRNTSALLLVAGGGGGAGNIPSLRNDVTNRGVIEGGAAGNANPVEGSDITKGLLPALRRGQINTTATFTIDETLSTPYKFITGSYNKLKTDEDNKYYGEYAPGNSVTYGTTNGKGVNGRDGNGAVYEGGGGGGGGYYGGNAITASATVENSGSGGGGSNYVDTGSGGFTEITNETAAGYGAGKFIIEYIPQ
ncbi:MAG: hypothetical protein LBJ35_07265 [Spirochaetaceae bacterium]|nr:hypothetical protein [Spirochaetaceae bacterium]